MQRARRDVIVASCICVVFLSATITVAANAKSRKVSAADIIVLSDDIHKQTTQVEHSGDNPSGVEAGAPKGASAASLAKPPPAHNAKDGQVA